MPRPRLRPLDSSYKPPQNWNSAGLTLQLRAYTRAELQHISDWNQNGITSSSSWQQRAILEIASSDHVLDQTVRRHPGIDIPGGHCCCDDRLEVFFVAVNFPTLSISLRHESGALHTLEGETGRDRFQGLGNLELGFDRLNPFKHCAELPETPGFVELTT